MEGLSSDFFLDGSGGGNIGSTDRIFLQFAAERNMTVEVGWLGRPARGGTHHVPEAFEDDP